MGSGARHISAWISALARARPSPPPSGPAQQHGFRHAAWFACPGDHAGHTRLGLL